MSGAPEPPTHGFQIPPLGQRILASGLRLVPLLVLLVGLPLAGLTFLGSHGISLPVSDLTVTGFGLAIAVLAAARSVVRPSRAYGPVSIATSATAFVYLLVLLTEASYHIAVPGSSVTISLNVARLIALLLLVPAFGIAAGVVTTIEDARHPMERLPYEYPA